MQLFSRLVALWLLLGMAASSGGAQSFLLSAQPAHPAGCHAPRPATPPAAPASYQCCVNGHHAAIPSAPVSLRPLLAEFSRKPDSGGGSASLLLAHVAVIAASSSSPPGSAPLRI